MTEKFEEYARKPSEEKVIEVTEKIMEGIDQNLVENSLQNNFLEFQVGAENYRVNKPTFSQSQEIAKYKIKKFNQLIKDPDLLFEKELKIRLKEKGIDLDQLQEKINNLEIQKKSLQYKLGEMLTNKAPENELKEFKDEIIELVKEQNRISYERSIYLEFSLENQLIVYVYAYTTFLVTEKKVGESWEKAWKSYEEFETCNDIKLLKKAGYFTTLFTSEDSLLI